MFPYLNQLKYFDYFELIENNFIFVNCFDFFSLKKYNSLPETSSYDGFLPSPFLLPKYFLLYFFSFKKFKSVGIGKNDLGLFRTKVGSRIVWAFLIKAVPKAITSMYWSSTHRARDLPPSDPSAPSRHTLSNVHERHHAYPHGTPKMLKKV